MNKVTPPKPKSAISHDERATLKLGIEVKKKKEVLPADFDPDANALSRSIKGKKQIVLPEGFSFGKNGLNYLDPNADDSSLIWICSKLEVVAVTCDENYLNYGRALEFKDTLGRDKSWVMPMNLLKGRNEALHGILLDMGLSLSTSAKAKGLLAQYLQMCKGMMNATCVFKTGWFKGAYVLPDRTIGGDPDNPVLFQTDNPLTGNFESKGTLDLWRENVARFAVGNSRISFAISASFTAPLLSLFGIEGGGFHFRGESSKGKTITLYSAGSVWGSHKRKRMWRATSNGLEMTAYMHNDSLLLLDEMGEMSPKEIGQTVYMLANGQAKQRANDVRLKEWRLLFLSTGELDLKSAMQTAGDTTKAGQEVRMIDLEAVVGEFGVFDVLLAGFEDSRLQAEALQEHTSNYYGVAGIEFLKQLISRKEEARNEFKKYQALFIENETPKNANSQVSRAINRFAIVAAGGELATYLGVTGWEAGEAYAGIKACFDGWCSNLISSTESHEETSAIKVVRSFIAKHGESRFLDLRRANDTHAPKTINLAGWKQVKVGTLVTEDTLFHFSTDVFADEVCKGLDPKLVLKTLNKHGYLKTESGGKTVRLKYRKLRIGEHEYTNSYAVRAKILEHE